MLPAVPVFARVHGGHSPVPCHSSSTGHPRCVSAVVQPAGITMNGKSCRCSARGFENDADTITVRLAFTTHTTSSLARLGAVVVFLALGVVGLTSREEWMVRGQRPDGARAVV